MEHFDIAEIPHPEDSFDLVLCSHVLEHVADDRAALRELHRVLGPGGSAIVLVPLDTSLPETNEDPAVVGPDEREQVFGQHDHVRQYGLDFAGRLEDAGFRIAIDRYVRTLDDEEIARFACLSDGMWVCVKPA